MARAGRDRRCARASPFVRLPRSRMRIGRARASRRRAAARSRGTPGTRRRPRGPGRQRSARTATRRVSWIEPRSRRCGWTSQLRLRLRQQLLVVRIEELFELLVELSRDPGQHGAFRVVARCFGRNARSVGLATRRISRVERSISPVDRSLEPLEPVREHQRFGARQQDLPRRWRVASGSTGHVDTSGSDPPACRMPRPGRTV